VSLLRAAIRVRVSRAKAGHAISLVRMDTMGLPVDRQVEVMRTYDEAAGLFHRLCKEGLMRGSELPAFGWMAR
jgi:hypothetical protein